MGRPEASRRDLRGILLALAMAMALVTLLALRQRLRIAGIVSGRHAGEGARG
ncbi:hypothetical protein [Cupriavidus sp. D39]|uniref:hypothetical protein n=1 Tax=Cupriavidus sp. D39 TaxID=2997877 RepID=UPI00226E8122|nr:hypothetical protein [Cupriavidus sp. D39]MCY0855358.1 hypothetical protein [Cupriavidus sp. D39]